MEHRTKAGPQSSACRRHYGCRRRALPSRSRSPHSNPAWYPTLRQTEERPFSGTATRFFTHQASYVSLEGRWVRSEAHCLHLLVSMSVHINNQCASERGICVNLFLGLRSIIVFEHVNLYAATSERAPSSNLRSDTVKSRGLHDIPLYGALGGKLDSWTWHDVVKFLKTFWQTRRHGSWDLVALRATEPAAVRIRLRKLRGVARGPQLPEKNAARGARARGTRGKDGFRCSKRCLWRLPLPITWSVVAGSVSSTQRSSCASVH